ncbi:MAG: hypothetical protein IJW36_03725 [Clostridia bacterium]|nr:hypothetical protein [Clostridia bacterium]
MFKIKSVKGEEFKLLDKETKEVYILKSNMELLNFIKDNEGEIDYKFIMDVLECVENKKVASAIFADWADDIQYYLSGMSQKLICQYMKSNAELFNVETFVDFLDCLDSKWKDKLCNDLNSFPARCQIALLKASENKELMIQYWQEHNTALEPHLQAELLIAMEDENLMRDFYVAHKDELGLECIVNILMRIDDPELQIDFCESNKDKVDVEYLGSIVEKIKDDNFKLSFLIENAMELDESFKAYIVRTFTDSKVKLDYLRKNPYLINPFNRLLLDTLSFEELSEIYFESELKVASSISISKMFGRSSNENQKFDFIIKNLDKFNASMFDELINYNQCVNKETYLQFLVSIRDNLNSEQLVFLILNSEPKQQVEYYKEFQDKIEEIHKHILILSLKEKGVDVSKLEDMNTGAQLTNEIREIVDKILQNFGLYVSINQNAVQLLSPQSIACMGEENVYQLFKYCVVTNTLPDTSKIMENPDLFNAYQQFRKENFPQDSLDVVNMKNTFIEFNKYYNLIANCLTIDLSDQEKQMLVSVLGDKNIEISSKEELLNYPVKRSEYIDELMNTKVEDAIAYILTGKKWGEFSELSNLFHGESSLENALNDFGDELQDEIILIMAMKEIMDLIKNESKETQKIILSNLKLSLEQEFSIQGSPIAEMRNVVPEFGSRLRTLYGKELQKSLIDSQLPPAQKSKGVDVINLNGQDFKLLVHGLNAYGAGTANYEHNEVGKAYICTSLISHRNTARARAGIYYGFKNISSKSLALEASGDMSSYASNNSLEITTKRPIVMFASTEKLLQEGFQTQRYNEIVLYRDQVDEQGNIKPITPDYIVAFGKISAQDRAEAKRLNIPIVLINERKYRKQIEQQKKEQREETLVSEPKQEVVVEVSVLREQMMRIIQQARNCCTASQQEAIKLEIEKQFKLSHIQDNEKQEIHNV